jgi:hypothetical protein
MEGESLERRDRLERMRRLYAFLERELPKLFERFEATEADAQPGYSAQVGSNLT